MPYPPVLTTAGAVIRSIRVDNLLPTMDAEYIFQCFNDNVEVLAATVIHVIHRGFVEFVCQGVAQFVLETYNDELMPNCSDERYSLSWDKDGFGTRWRWDPFFERLSFFGHDNEGDKLTASDVVELYGDDPHAPAAAKPNAASRNNDFCSVGYMDISGGFECLKLTDMPLSPHPNSYQGVYAAGYQNYQHPSLTIQQYQPYQTPSYGGCGGDELTVIQNNMMPPHQINLSHGGHAQYVSYQEQYIYPQPCAYQPPSQQLQTQFINVGTLHKAGPLTQVLTGDLKMVGSMEKKKKEKEEAWKEAWKGKGKGKEKGKEKEKEKWNVKGKEKEKELYLCFHEFDSELRSSYVFRTVKLSDILACSCNFSDSTFAISQCEHCATKTKPESQLRQRAWLCGEENVPAGRGGKEMRIPCRMGCCASGSHIFFAGGSVQVPDLDPWDPYKSFAPSGDVSSFSLESNGWRKLEWSFVEGKPDPLFFEVDGNFYCLASMPRSRNMEKPTFEVYNSSTGKCEVLPDPPFYHNLGHVPNNELSYAIVGTKILVSNNLMYRPVMFPIACFDVNDKEKGWREMPNLFDGKPFPFHGRALVLDLNGATSDKVMFSFREKSIFVSRLVVNVDDGDMSISVDYSLPFSGANHLMDHCMGSGLSHDFIDLGSQRVAFILCGNICRFYRERFGIYDFQKVRVVVVVIQYGESAGSKYPMTDILATRCFEYNCHSPGVSFSHLVGSFVV